MDYAHSITKRQDPFQSHRISRCTIASAVEPEAMYLHFSNPRRYEDGRSGMENFIYERNDDYETMGVKYLPRLFKLTTGDLFTTDFEYSSLKFGNHEIVKVKDTTMPNGKAGVLYRVVK